MINVGIVGAGYIGEIHINAINKLGDTRIAGVVDIVEEKGKSIAEKVRIILMLSQFVSQHVFIKKQFWKLQKLV